MTKPDFLEDLMPDFNKGEIIPIISNSFRIEQIFQEEKKAKEKIANAQRDYNDDLTVDEQITRQWAASEDVGYPMPDIHNLARIAQYHSVEMKDHVQARVDYVNFLKKHLLASQDEEESVDLVNSLNRQVKKLRFSEIVSQLDLPRFSEGAEDSLRLLARLPLPIYVTTSYYDFLEQALEAEGKHPRIQVCFWSGGRSKAKDHLSDPELVPFPNHPAVYHLFGLEDHPETLVLSEDDYMNFLIKSVGEDTDTQYPIIPLILRESLADFRLLLLGYQLRDWDFRVLFRLIAEFRNETSSPRGLVIQLKPDRKRIGDEEKARKYLSDYFDRKAFHFEWTDTESFVQKLWHEWNIFSQG